MSKDDNDDQPPAVASQLVWARQLYRDLKPHLPGVTSTRPGGASEGPLFVPEGEGYHVALPRLEAIEDALRRDAPVDERMRLELLALIAHVAGLHEDDAKPRQPSHFQAAATVLALRRLHGVSLKAALSAVIPDSLKGEQLHSLREAVRKQAERIEKSGEKVVALESWVQKATERMANKRTKPRS